MYKLFKKEVFSKFTLIEGSKKVHFFIGYLLCFLCFFHLSPKASGELIRIGINRDEVILHQLGLNNKDSWFIEELREWGGKNGYEPEFIIKEWSELEKEFNEGKLDAIYPTNSFPERHRNMVFTKVIKRDPISIFSKKEDKVISLENLKRKKIGCINSTLFRINLTPIFSNITYFTSSERAVNALEQGELDYLVLSRGAANLYSKELYAAGDLWFNNEGSIALQKDKTHVLRSLNKHFFYSNGYLKNKILNKLYLDEAETLKFKLNKFLKVRKPETLKVVVHKDAAPFVEVKEGKLVSTSIDIVNLFNSLSPYITLEVIPPSDQLTYNGDLERLKTGEIDIMMPTGVSEERNRIYKRINYEKVNYTDSVVLLAHSFSKNISSLYEARGVVGTVNSHLLEGILFSNLPASKVRIFADRREALEALNSGEIQYLLDTTKVIDSYLSVKNYNNIKKLFALNKIAYTAYFYPGTSEEVLDDFKLIMNSIKNRWQYNKPKGIEIAPLFAARYLLQVKMLLILILSTFIFYQRRHIKEKLINERIFNALVESLENVNHVNNEETGEHIVRIGLYSEILAKALLLPKVLTREIKTFASLHDVGKIGVPKEILAKPGKLTKEEFDEMKLHTIKGGEIIKNLSGIPSKPDLALNITLHHHEKWDGSGYPACLKGEEIPIEARIVALADVYDALRMPRVYKRGLSHEESCNIIIAGAGKHFDPQLVDLFKKNHMEFNVIYLQNS